MSYLYFAIAFFFAGVVPELTGFGVATVAMPILSLVLPFSVVLPLVAMLLPGLSPGRTLHSDAISRLLCLCWGQRSVCRWE